LQGYPTIKEETNVIVRSSKRHSARRHQYVEDNDEEDEEEDDIDDRRRKREPRGKLAKRKGKMVRSSSKYSTHRSSQEVMSSSKGFSSSKANDDNCLYSRVKTSSRRAKSAVTYSEYGSTVTNAKKTPAKRQSSYELRRRYQHESSESKRNNLINPSNFINASMC